MTMSVTWPWRDEIRGSLFAAVLFPFMLCVANVGVCRDYEFDVVVFGATPGGVAAAIGAAREGVSVALVEPTDLIGAMMTGGLSHSDSDQTDRRVLKGLFEEMHLRIEKDYNDRGIELPYEVSNKLDGKKWVNEPHVAEQVFLKMLQEAGVAIFPSQRHTGVEKTDGSLQALHTEKDTFRGKVFVDGTYEGDLMAAAGVSWTLGRESRGEFDESFAGRRYPKQAVNGFSPRNEQGQLLPFITTDQKGNDEEGDRRVMTYSFRLCLTKDPANRVSIQKPENYDPADFELVRRFVKTHPPSRLLIDLYPLPGNKFDGNNSIGGQIGIGLVGGGNCWCEASYVEREQIWKAHRDYTEGLLWFMATDPAMPEPLRKQMQEFGYCKDEFARWGHFPPALYVREGRRMKGEYILTQKDVLETREKEDSIGISSFPIDSHDIQRIALDDGFIDEGTIFPVRVPGRRRVGYASQVPYRAIVPERKECRNLLVPVALSATHVAYSSIRVEPTWIVIGHSSGVAAALAAKSDVSVQDLPYPQLRKRLEAQGQALALPPPFPEATTPQPGR